ncbi:hypothetical protein CN692_25615 [Bacillus sp. AFS002410]|uniref:hypothetical protein n=1 Tax=Bacillus sp. AFS002410 TaxID=2033481 RepID=UPI000BF23D99|nr:hypothetical protein [Bacillus sp. AFS002410]PEJ46683.1 hypothetical protein CN692_25615 [Bacillus sp. AFS002410]
MVGYAILGFVIVMIGFGFFMEKKFGTGNPDKSNNQTMDEEIGRYTTSHQNNTNTSPGPF